jgi:DNA-dependent RNA polymerase auxiliary subunit epsilon
MKPQEAAAVRERLRQHNYNLDLIEEYIECALDQEDDDTTLNLDQRVEDFELYLRCRDEYNEEVQNK